MSDLAIFILTHGRAANVATVKALKKHGYTGRWFIVIDNEDDQQDEYVKRYGDKVIVFDKKVIAKTFDEGDNFNDRRAIIYARNACFGIAEKLGIKYFMQMDDDYTIFEYRVYNEENQKPKRIQSMDKVIDAMMEFYTSTNIHSISMAQGGDFIGGKGNRMARKPTLSRKCMNSFICSTDRPFTFVGRINEDVNTYTNKAGTGTLMVTNPFCSLVQKQTQSNKGGMSDLYIDSGTYVKSFYSIMYSPSCVKIKPMGDTHVRLHHSVKWDHAVPKIISEGLRKTDKQQT